MIFRLSLFFIAAAVIQRPGMNITGSGIAQPGSQHPALSVATAIPTLPVTGQQALPLPTTMAKVIIPSINMFKISSPRIQAAMCTPHKICMDYISPCGQRYGGCYDRNYCDGNTSPYPIPTCMPT
ncbi:uncharacterized protein RCC_02813 [Ramularia collo-cygni]|uniref:Uncharacterized protein n=1 Tax=Ramularia collo-cygni TaxID=112498 RepID=A0A2D3UP48_9PEZI|nr:uncharacterized protein RCC_02813 [Ramularia collo-cygni]CZT16981.1 uncharacterized protein RCC_02813 [Ramularia collo-cygni]